MYLRWSTCVVFLVLHGCAPELGVAADPVPVALQAGGDGGHDVIVVGAGAGGIAAAIQAARMGRSVVLIEPSNHVGGQLLTVTSMDESLQVPAPDVPPDRREGIYAELADRVVRHYGDKPVGTCYFNDNSLCYEAREGEQILREMIAEAGVRLETGRDVLQVVIGQPHQVTGVVTADGVVWPARIVIDATEYGDVLPLAGAAYRVGNQVRDLLQPPSSGDGDAGACVQETTYTVTIKRYDVLPPELDLRGWTPPGGHDDYELHAPFYRTIVRELPPDTGCDKVWDWKCHAAYRGTPDRDNPDNYVASQYRHTKTMVNALNDYPTQHSLADLGLPIAAVEDRAARRVHECAARMLTTQFIYYGQQELGMSWGASDEGSPFAPNLDHCDQFDARALGTEQLFPVRPYVREGRRMIGVQTVTGTDIARKRPSTFKQFDVMALRSWATALMVGYYGNDLHGCWGDSRLESGLGDQSDLRTGGGPYQLPFGAFIPRDIDGLLAAEKNLSMSRLVNAAVRVQPASMMTGMAAGTIAAIAVARSVQPRDVPPVLVQDALLASRVPNNLSLFTYDDVPLGSPRWGDVQLASTHGVLIGVGNFQFGASQPLTRAQGAVAMQRTFRYPLDPPSSVDYADVPIGSPYWRFVQAMTRMGITAGCGSDASGHPLFCPDVASKRRELAAWIVAALGLDHPPCAVRPYLDVPISDPYCPVIAALKRSGLAVACDVARFCPGDPVTREDTTAFTRRAMVYMASMATAVGDCYRRPPLYCDL